MSDETRQKLRDAHIRVGADRVYAGLRRSNNSKKIKVGMIENDVIIRTFESLSEACNFLGINSRTYAGRIKQYADKYNKNGQRAKFHKYAWTLIQEE